MVSYLICKTHNHRCEQDDKNKNVVRNIMKKLSEIRMRRRTLLKGLGVIGLASLSPCAFSQASEDKKPLPVVRLKLGDYQTFRSTCAMECLHCNLTAYVHQGELKKIEASKDFNVKCCLRGMSRTKWVSHPLRVKTPMLRIGEKGEGKFKPITWDEALDLIEKIFATPLPATATRAC